MRTLESRFWSKVAAGDPRECWPWLGAQTHGGYGHLLVRRRFVGAHRVAYELFYGEIPSGMVIDHLCRNHACVNPLHLEAVSNRENLRRGINGVLTTHCPAGHPYDEKNTHYAPHPNRAPTRICRACGRIRYHETEKARRQKRRIERAQPAPVQLRRPS